jgi:phosphatidylglycerophosphate synthase
MVQKFLVWDIHTDRLMVSLALILFLKGSKQNNIVGVMTLCRLFTLLFVRTYLLSQSD